MQLVISRSFDKIEIEINSLVSVNLCVKGCR